jgi:hypothetical protein
VVLPSALYSPKRRQFIVLHQAQFNAYYINVDASPELMKEWAGERDPATPYAQQVWRKDPSDLSFRLPEISG